MSMEPVTSNTVELPPRITSRHTPLGTKVTCSGCGMIICEVVVTDAYLGCMKPQSEIFGKWRVPEPKLGQAFGSITCPSCGGRWLKDPYTNTKGELLHFEGYGWWPGKPEKQTVSIPPEASFKVRKSWWQRFYYWMRFTK